MASALSHDLPAFLLEEFKYVADFQDQCRNAGLAIYCFSPNVVYPIFVMSREIEFRVWENGKRVIPYNPNKSGEEDFEVSTSPDGEARVNRRFLGEYDGVIKGAIIEQFTGLKDRNGREVYEGDIISIIGDKTWKHEGIYTVNYDRGSFNLTHKSLTMGFRTLIDLDFQLVEVIGDTHEGIFKDNVV